MNNIFPNKSPIPLQCVPPSEESSGRTSALARFRVLVAGLCALVLSVGLARFAYTPMLPQMRDQAGLSVDMGGWLATSNYAGYMVGAFVMANTKTLETKFKLYRAGLIVALLTTVLMGFTESAVVWAVLRFLSGLSSTAGLLLASGLVLNWLMVNGHKPELGVHFTGMGIGIIVSGVAVEAMSGWVDWAGMWKGLGALGAAFFLLAWFWMPSPTSVLAVQAAGVMPSPSRRWKTILAWAYLCAGYGYVVSATFIVDLVHNLPSLANLGNWVWVVVGLAAMPTSYVWDRLVHRYGIIPALGFAYALQICSFLLPVMGLGSVGLVVSAVMFGGTFVGIVSLTLALIGRYHPVNPAKAMARLTLSYGAAQVLGPVVTAYLTSYSGSYNSALIAAALVMLLGSGLLMWLIRLPVNEPHG